MNLLDALILAGLRPRRIHAEVVRPELTVPDLRAHVEFRMTPRVVGEGASARFDVEVRVSCRVTGQLGEERQEVMIVEYVAVALYRPRPGFEISQAWFQAGHSDLGRQLYPLMQQRVEPIFADFGLRELRLPIEVVPEKQQTAAGPTH